jgi:hypothetical protein
MSKRNTAWRVVIPRPRSGDRRAGCLNEVAEESLNPSRRACPHGSRDLRITWSVEQTCVESLRIAKSVSASLVTHLARHWIGKLAHYGVHRNDEHCLALLEEAVRYTGLHLENDLAHSKYWSAMPLHQRAVVLLFLVDRGVVERGIRRGRRVYEPLPHAESWVESQVSLRPYLKETLELLAALRRELFRRTHSRQF